MRINCYKTAFQIYIVYALFPFMHALPSVVQVTVIAIAFVLLGMHIALNIHSSWVATTVGIMILSFLFTYMVFKGEYTTTIFSAQFGIQKFLMLFLFWFPLFLLPGMYQVKAREELSGLFKLVLFICTITAITTLIGILRFDEPCRQLAKGTSELMDFYQSINIGGYGYIYTLIFLIPVLIEQYKKKKKPIYILLIVLYLACVVGSSYGTAFVVLIITIGVYIFLNTRLNVITKFVIAGLIAISVFMSERWISIISFLSWVFEQLNISTLSIRMDQIYRSLTLTTRVGDLAERAQLRTNSIDVFKSNILLGNLGLENKIHLGMHSELCDLLGGTGIVGLAIFIILIMIVVKYIRLHISSEQMRNIYISIGCSCLFLLYFNTIISSIEILLIVVAIVFSDIQAESTKNEDIVY